MGMVCGPGPGKNITAPEFGKHFPVKGICDAAVAVIVADDDGCNINIGAEGRRNLLADIVAFKGHERDNVSAVLRDKCGLAADIREILRGNNGTPFRRMPFAGPQIALGR